MACMKRLNTGHCKHFQCPFSQETTHGYECLDIIAGKYCEAGENCLEKCTYSYKADDKKAQQEIDELLKQEFPEDFAA